MGRFFSLQISKVLEVPLIRMERFFEVVPNSFGPKMQNIFLKCYILAWQWPLTLLTVTFKWVFKQMKRVSYVTQLAYDFL